MRTVCTALAAALLAVAGAASAATQSEQGFNTSVNVAHRASVLALSWARGGSYGGRDDYSRASVTSGPNNGLVGQP